METNMASSDFLIVADPEVRENCEESFEDRFTEGFVFIRDDTGVWYARSNVRGRGFNETRWWRVTGAIPDDLDGVIEKARELMHAGDVDLDLR
jgi:hypothetical protein